VPRAGVHAATHAAAHAVMSSAAAAATPWRCVCVQRACRLTPRACDRNLALSFGRAFARAGGRCTQRVR
jgi:hypothetical protein